jgi:hypothetical protein
MHFETTYGATGNYYTVQEGYVLDSSNNYQPFFETKYDYTPFFQTAIEKAFYVSKIDSEGNFITQVSMNGCYAPGQTICRIEDDRFLVAVFRFWGDGAEIESWMGPITYPRDNNSVFLYKIDSDGNEYFSNIIQDVLVFETIDQILDNNIEFNLAVQGESYVLNLPNTTYLTDHDGWVQEQYQPNFNFTGNHTFSMACADNTSNYFIGSADYYNSDSVFYLVKAGLTGNAIWYHEIDPIMDARLRSAQDGFFALICRQDDQEVIKYKEDGEMQWQRELDRKPDVLVSTCSNGLIIANHLEFQQQIILIKTDSEGNN